MKLRISEFSENLIPGAASIFCAQYKVQRKSTPMLPKKYGRREVVTSLLSGMLGRSSGVAAFNGARIVGYMVGSAVPGFIGSRSGIYSPEWAHSAVAEGRGKIYGHMYRAAAQRWVSEGGLVHCLTLLASDSEALDTLGMTGFGTTTVDAMMDPAGFTRPCPHGVRIMSIGAHLISDVVPLSIDLEAHLAGSPTFLPRPRRNWRKYYAQFLSGKNTSVWVAYKGERPVSYMKCEPSTVPGACQIVRDARVLKISGAYTVPELRHEGIASAVLSTLLRANRGTFSECSVDFESANLTASDFWLRHFSPVCYSMVRQIDERILRSR